MCEKDKKLGKKEFEEKIKAELITLLPNMSFNEERHAEENSIKYLVISGPNPKEQNHFLLEQFYPIYINQDKTIKDIASDIAEEYTSPQEKRSCRLIAEELNDFAISNNLFKSAFCAFSPNMVMDAYEEEELSKDDLHTEILSQREFHELCNNNADWMKRMYSVCEKFMRAQRAVCFAIDSVKSGISFEYPEINPIQSDEPREQWRQTLLKELKRMHADDKEISEVFSSVYTEKMACNTLSRAEKMYDELINKYGDQKHWENISEDDMNEVKVKFIRAAAVLVLDEYEKEATEMEDE